MHEGGGAATGVEGWGAGSGVSRRPRLLENAACLPRHHRLLFLPLLLLLLHFHLHLFLLVLLLLAMYYSSSSSASQPSPSSPFPPPFSIVFIIFFLSFLRFMLYLSTFVLPSAMVLVVRLASLQSFSILNMLPLTFVVAVSSWTEGSVHRSRMAGAFLPYFTP